MLLKRVAPVLAALVLLAGCGGDDDSAATTGAGAATTAQAGGGDVRDIATGLEVPWGIAFLPGGDALVSERISGRILRVPAGGGRAEEVLTVPGVDGDAGEGGLLGLAVSRDFAQDGYVYAYLTTARDNRVVRFKLDGGGVEPILTGLAANSFHNGGRIGFGPDGMLYVGVGDAGDTALAQRRSSPNGKILRIAPDGSIPRDNPFRGSPVWSMGHRNPQGLAWDEQGRLWAAEFGQDTYDEVNLIRKGRNYGWPVVEGQGSTRGGKFTNPAVTWTTDEASPSGAAIVDGVMTIGALQGQDLLRVRLDGRQASKLQPLLKGEYGRLRTVVAAPDGALWVTTSNRDGRGDPRDGDDRIIRIAP